MVKSIGSKTPWGTVEAISFREGERYYMMINKHGVVSLMPADVVEPDHSLDSEVGSSGKAPETDSE